MKLILHNKKGHISQNKGYDCLKSRVSNRKAMDWLRSIEESSERAVLAVAEGL